MSDPFIGEIRMFGGNFAPRGWALCNGQLLSISQNTALFSLLGTTYGGNGQTTFGLPNLQSRVPMHAGQGPGLSPRTLGEVAGEESVTLTTTQMPAHGHLASGTNTAGAATRPGGNVPAATSAGAYGPSPTDPMNGSFIASAGGSQPHDNMSPYLVVNFIIALEGIFPSRN
ncbi:MAG: phage tail protein [Acidimicrobiales bacterium]